MEHSSLGQGNTLTGDFNVLIERVHEKIWLNDFIRSVSDNDLMQSLAELYPSEYIQGLFVNFN